MAPQGRPRAGPRPRLQGQATRQGDPVRDLRSRRRHGLGQRRHRPRHRAVRRRLDHGLVAPPRPQALPRRHDADDHRRLRRLKRQPHTAVEDRAATPRRRYRPADHGLPSAARHEQVEQNRAPPVQLHQPQLARPTTRIATGHRQPHRRDDLDRRPTGLRPTRRARLPRQDPRQRRRAERRRPHRACLPPGVELHHQPPTIKIDAS